MGRHRRLGSDAEALEKLLGHPIRTRVKMKFVITKKPLPGIVKPSKSGVKPIDYMYPVDLVKDRKEIDLEWYKKMIENYVQGAFGLSDIADNRTERTRCLDVVKLSSVLYINCPESWYHLYNKSFKRRRQHY